MSSRLIEVFVPDARRDQAEALLTDYPDLEAWYEPLFGQKLWIRIFVDQVNVEAIVDQFAQRFDEVEGFRLLILDVEATLPYLEIEAASASASLTDKLTPDIEDALDPRSTRVNRIEIYDQVAEGSQLSWVQIVMISRLNSIGPY